MLSETDQQDGPCQKASTPKYFPSCGLQATIPVQSSWWAPQETDLLHSVFWLWYGSHKPFLAQSVCLWSQTAMAREKNTIRTKLKQWTRLNPICSYYIDALCIVCVCIPLWVIWLNGVRCVIVLSVTKDNVAGLWHNRDIIWCQHKLGYLFCCAQLKAEWLEMSSQNIIKSTELD